MNNTDYASLIALIKTFILVSGALVGVITAGTAMLMYRLYNVFVPRKEWKVEQEKTEKILHHHTETYQKILLESKTHEIYIQQLKESMKEHFAAQQQVFTREMQHLSNNMKQQSQNSAKAIEAVMELQNRMDRLEKKN